MLCYFWKMKSISYAHEKYIFTSRRTTYFYAIALVTFGCILSNLFFNLQLYMPRCTGLTAEGVVKIVQALYECKGNLNRIRLHGICRMTKHHLDAISSAMCKGNQQKDDQSLFYSHRVHEVLNTNDERHIDVDVCPICTNVRLVFDCTRDGCRFVPSDLLNSYLLFASKISLQICWKFASVFLICLLTTHLCYMVTIFSAFRYLIVLSPVVVE